VDRNGTRNAGKNFDCIENLRLLNLALELLDERHQDGGVQGTASGQHSQLHEGLSHEPGAGEGPPQRRHLDYQLNLSYSFQLPVNFRNEIQGFLDDFPVLFTEHGTGYAYSHLGHYRIEFGALLDLTQHSRHEMHGLDRHGDAAEPSEKEFPEPSDRSP